MMHAPLHSKSRGFTIAELLIAMGIFVIAISVATVVFIRALKAQRAVIAYSRVNDNLALALEQMAREIRTGSAFVNDGSVDSLKFKSAQEATAQASLTGSKDLVNVYYHFDQNSKAITRHAEGGTPEPITAKEVQISNVQFLIDDSTNPPLITITLTAQPADPSLQGNYELNLQTSVSPRVL